MASADECKNSDSKPPFNFGPTTDACTSVCGAARPGAREKRCYSPDLRVPRAEVDEWVAFMRGEGVRRVVSLLSESELATYEEPLPEAMREAFGAQGGYINVDAKAPGAAAKIMGALRAAKDAGERVVVHCWGGGGRTGLVQAAGLVVLEGAAPEAAAEAVSSYAAARGLSRRVDLGALKEFLAAAGRAGGQQQQ